MIDAISAEIEAARRDQAIPGVGVAVTQGDDVLLAEGFGLADVERNVAVSAESVFELASITKLFTAEAVLLLAQQNRLQLSDPIGNYLPDLPAAWQPIAIHHLLAHQSGIRNYTSVDAYWQTTRLDVAREDILALVADLPLDFAPGERNRYDNSAYFLLGMLIEAVSSQPYDQFLHDAIFAPLGMAATRANDPYAIIPNRVQGYSLADGDLRRAEYYATAGTFSAGILVSSAADMARWMASLHGEAILSQAWRANMWRSRPSRQANEREHHFSMGLGWFQVDYRGRQFWGHNGSIVGFATALMHFIEPQLSVCVLCNLDAVAEPHALAFDIAERVLAR